MRVAFDATTLAFKQKTGTGVFAEELLKAYEKLFIETDEIIHTYRLSRRIRGRQFLRPLTQGVKRDTLLDPLTSFKGRYYDIFHGLNTRLPMLHHHAKLIASVHDLFSIYGEYSKGEFKTDQAIKLNQMISRSDHITVLATYTKNQLENKLGINPRKITVVAPGVRDCFLETGNKEKSKTIVRERFGLKNPFIFYVGALEKRKNVAGLVEAFSYLMKDYKKPLDLVLAGHPGFEFEVIEKAINDSEVKDKIKILGFVGEEELAHLYGACEIFALLSFEEGFGMPVIEAMACGAPAISSNTTSLPEVGNGFSWLVDPRSKEEIARTLYHILNYDPKTIERVKLGERYARTCTWEKVATKFRDVYKSQFENIK